MNIVLSVDKKGRILVPSNIRHDLHIEDHVAAQVTKEGIHIAPLRPIKDPLAMLTSIKVKTSKTPVQMKREAEEGFLR